MSLLDLLARLTCGPAGILRGRTGLQPGCIADLLLFNPDTPGRISTEDFKSKSKNSPFDGHLIQGKVLRTVVDGRTIYQAPEKPPAG